MTSLEKSIPSQMNDPAIGIILLAAGASRRMGRPKQLLKIGSETLIEKTISISQTVEHQEILVVLGANANRIKPLLRKNKSLNYIINDNWEMGMGTSLSAGMSYFLETEKKLDGLIVLVCDQPYLTTQILENLIDTFRNSNADIVAASYGGNFRGARFIF